MDVDEAVCLLATAVEVMHSENSQAMRRLEEDRRLRHEQDQAYAAAVERDEEM